MTRGKQRRKENHARWFLGNLRIRNNIYVLLPRHKRAVGDCCVVLHVFTNGQKQNKSIRNQKSVLNFMNMVTEIKRADCNRPFVPYGCHNTININIDHILLLISMLIAFKRPIKDERVSDVFIGFYSLQNLLTLVTVIVHNWSRTHSLIINQSALHSTPIERFIIICLTI